MRRRSLFLAVIGVGIAATLLLSRPVATPHRTVAPDVGIGTVRQITDVITMEVESVTGGTFTGLLRDDSVVEALRPGTVLMVAFDPLAREHLSLADDMLAVRAVFDRMLVDKGLLTGAPTRLDSARHPITRRGHRDADDR